MATAAAAVRPFALTARGELCGELVLFERNIRGELVGWPAPIRGDCEPNEPDADGVLADAEGGGGWKCGCGVSGS